MRDFSVEPLAEDALLLRFGDHIAAETNARVHEAARALRVADMRGLIDIAPAYATLLLRFDPFVLDGDAFLEKIAKALDDGRAVTRAATPRSVEIPVCYGGEYGPDIAAVAEHANLATDEIIARHSVGKYFVAMLGFAPGFPYLLGLDPALNVPRRANPRTHVPAGSVAIGGAQTGIYPRELPGGWHLIGRTPSRLFDPRRDPACLLAPGDRVCLRVIDPDEYGRLAASRE